MTGLKRTATDVSMTPLEVSGGFTFVVKVVLMEWPAGLVTVTVWLKTVSEDTVGGVYWETKAPAVFCSVMAPLSGEKVPLPVTAEVMA
ncbi:hypothetical protein [Corallococcus exiguus]|uniref:hypothetical protein n=1 Tax=Corallococcus exiguus TaxID=83462 RepID=UPI003DA4D668